VPAVAVPQLKLASVFASVSVTPLPGVRAYTVTVAADATATIRSRPVVLRFRLIAAARLVASVAAVLDTSKSSPVFVVLDAVRVRVTAVSPVGVMVIDVVWTDVGSPVKVPTTLARVFPVEASMGNTAKSEVQLGGAFTLKEYLAGDIPCATPPAPSEMAQSFLSLPDRLRRLDGLRTRPESAGAFPWRSQVAYARGSFHIVAADSDVNPAVKTTCLELQSIGMGMEPSGRAKPCPNADALKPAANNSAAHLAKETTFHLRRALPFQVRVRIRISKVFSRNPRVVNSDSGNTP
jgi:hypothetical protein